MGIELRPLGISCNIACKYCYQNPQRKANNYSKKYDMDKMKEALSKAEEPFTLFGGEPLLMPFEDLEELFRWGFEKFKGSTIQTNGILINDNHIEIFKKYNVDIGISIDGPEELNDVRWFKNIDKTREMTKKTEDIIFKLCSEGLIPGLIVTLHKGNASKERLPKLSDWIKKLDEIGIKSVRLHMLEVDETNIRDTFAMSTEENIEALVNFIELEKKLKNIRFDITSEIRNLLLGKDSDASCVWRACDPFTTMSVRGIEGFGQESKCGRVNKEGIEYLRPESISYERYIHLYNTPDEQGGCQSCRFFLMCKGHCPGTSIKGDWRNKTEHCGVLKYLFSYVERELVLEGQTPLSLHPVRKRLEQNMISAWKRGGNPPLAALPWKANEDVIEKENIKNSRKILRKAWVSTAAKQTWEPRLERISNAMNKIEKKLGEKENFIPINGNVNLVLNLLDINSSFFIPSQNVNGEFNEFINSGKSEGFEEEMEWLSKIFSWKIDVTDRNGLKQIHTPLVKIVEYS